MAIMTTEQTLGKRINWSWAISAIWVKLSAWLIVLIGNQDWSGELKGLLISAIGIVGAWVAGKGTAKGSLGRKPKPATLDSTDPVGKGG